MAAALVLSPFLRKQRPPFVAPVRKRDLADLKELIEGGKISPVIGNTYPLSDTAAAFEYLAGGHARGKIAIAV